jgi:ubiquinol-cytochrome c reductase cytochrome c1 subunit
MRKLLAILCTSLALMPGLGFASGDSHPLDPAPVRANDMAGLQRGAKLFVNYCLNCHSANLMRYNRLKDIGLTDPQIKENLLFTSDKVGETMRVALTPKDAKEWFGASPPDLSVIARAKSSHDGPGAWWLYTYLRSYYRDNTKPTGWNNLVFPNVGMPHVLWELQGPRELSMVSIEPVKDEKGQVVKWQSITTTHDVDGNQTVKKEDLKDYHGHGSKEAKFTPKDPAKSMAYDQAVGDLVGYLSYMAEPVATERRRIGVWVLLYLGIFFVIAWRLNAVYWKDVK